MSQKINILCIKFTSRSIPLLTILCVKIGILLAYAMHDLITTQRGMFGHITLVLPRHFLKIPVPRH